VEWSYGSGSAGWRRKITEYVHLDGALSRDLVCEAARVEIRLNAADGQDKVSRLYLLLDLRMGDRPNVHLETEVRSLWSISEAPLTPPKRACSSLTAVLPIGAVCKSGTARASRFMRLLTGVCRELRLLDKLRDLFADIVPDRARVNEDDDILVRLLNELNDLVDHELLRLLVVWRWRGRKRRLQPGCGNLLVGDVRGKGQVPRPRLRTYQ
jgi:hypothetical protein